MRASVAVYSIIAVFCQYENAGILAMRCHAITFNAMRCHAITFNTMRCYAITFNAVLAKRCHTCYAMPSLPCDNIQNMAPLPPIFRIKSVEILTFFLRQF